MSFEERLAGAVREAVRKAYGIELNGIHVERPNDPSHGDFATNVALANARVFRRNPREVAENLVGALDAPFVREAGVAGPGFVNFRLSEQALWDGVGTLLREGDAYGRREVSGDPVLLEFVSVNPTGPMHVGHGRQAAYGDSLARIMETAAGTSRASTTSTTGETRFGSSASRSPRVTRASTARPGPPPIRSLLTAESTRRR